jgi:superfamily II DNA or RNA helicase/HKD family nuclease
MTALSSCAQPVTDTAEGRAGEDESHGGVTDCNGENRPNDQCNCRDADMDGVLGVCHNDRLLPRLLIIPFHKATDYSFPTLNYACGMTKPLVPGAYDQLVTSELADQLAGLPAERILREALGKEDGPVILARHLYFLILRSLKNLKESSSPLSRIQVSNMIIEAVSKIAEDYVGPDDLIIEDEFPVLSGLLDDPLNASGITQLGQPRVPLSQSALLVNGHGQPSIGSEIKQELTTANDVDLIMSFLKLSGVKLIAQHLEGVVKRGGRVRILTTTYTGATDRKAVDLLCRLGAEVKVSYDGTGTRLHAKAWIIKRHSGATTGYVGSSNLSGPAMTTGSEWNLRVSYREQPHIIDDLSRIFEEMWADKEYSSYDPDLDAEKLDAALIGAKSWGQGGAGGEATGLSISYEGFQIDPKLFQQEILDQIDSERKIHGRFKNLVVMATGTGKTVVSALDFQRLFNAGEVKTVLFVAHRQEILKQARNTFRAVMKSGTFGELFVDGHRPDNWNFVFASIQSLSQKDLSQFSPEQFDMIIVDEFHHYPASSYVKFLNYFKPKYLLGLTATPERTDGKQLLDLFDGVFAAELRLWEAIDRGVLSPFQYFGIHDNIDLDANVKWVNGHYDEKELSNLYTSDTIRVGLILKNIEEHVASIDDMKAIGFCVDVAHAKFMADAFSAANIPSVHVVGDTPSIERDNAILDLKSGKVKVIFAVDIYNEGVDIPDVNTLLMIRPTESGVVFVQQLGRGLRKTPNKPCLTVLDFVGNQNKKFKFAEKYGKLLGLGKKALLDAIDSGFPSLPSACHFELDAVASKLVMDNLKESIGFTKKQFAKDIIRLGDVDIDVFLKDTGIELVDLYASGNSFTLLKKLAFQPDYIATPQEKVTGSAMSRLLHIDDSPRLKYIMDLLNGVPVADVRFKDMFASILLGVDPVKNDYTGDLALVLQSALATELKFVVDHLGKNLNRVTYPSKMDIPLQVHARYTRNEVYAAFGVSTSGKFGSGTEWIKGQNSDLGFVTINKSEGKYSPTTMYADSAISDYLFQWESPSTISDSTPTGKRYVDHKNLKSSFHLFVREVEIDVEASRTMPYMYMGTCNYVSHTGNNPMRIIWQLDRPMPADILVKSKILAS